MRSIILFVLSCGIVVSGYSNWNQFRGPSGQGSIDASLPIKWFPKSNNILWRTPIGGKAWSSPIEFENKIFLTNAKINQLSNSLCLEAISFDLRDGREIWKTTLFDHQNLPNLHRKNSYASPTPFFDGEHLFVHFGNLGTACMDKNGKVIWKKVFDYSPVHGAGSSPVVFGKLLLFSADGATNPCIYALNKKDGSIAWKTERTSNAKKNFSFCTPLVVPRGKEFQIISPASDWCFAYDFSGREIWKTKYLGGYSVVPRPVYRDGVVYVSSGYDLPTLYAIEVDGSGDVSEKKVLWSTGKAVPRNSSPVIANGLLFMVSDAGVVSCLDAQTGELQWMKRVSSSVSASLLHSGGKIYLTDESGTTYVFMALREYRHVAKNELGERILASAMVYRDSLILRTESALYRIE